MNSKVVTFSAVVGFFAVTLTGCDNSATTTAQSQGTQAPTAQVCTVKIGSTGQSFPNGYKENDKLTGFDIEIAEKIGEKIGCKVEWTLAEFGGLMGQLETGRLDTIANNVVETQARRQKYNFSVPYVFYGTQIVTNVANTDINSTKDLYGKTVSGVLGSNHITNLKRAFANGEIEIKTYETRDGAVQDLIYNRVQGYVNSKPVLLADIKRNNLPFKLVGDPLFDEHVSFPFAKTPEGEKLLAQFNKALGELKQEGALTALSIKYYGEDISL